MRKFEVFCESVPRPLSKIAARLSLRQRGKSKSSMEPRLWPRETLWMIDLFNQLVWHSRLMQYVPKGPYRHAQTRKHCCGSISARNVSPFARTRNIRATYFSSRSKCLCKGENGKTIGSSQDRVT